MDNPKTNILILSYPDDPHVTAVRDILKQKKVQYTGYHFPQFPTRSNLSVELGNTSTRTLLKINQQPIDTQFTSIWYRRPGGVRVSRATDVSISAYMASESRAFLRDISSLFPNAFLLSDPLKITESDHKLRQLRLAVEVGLDIPDTYSGNDPVVASQMFEKYETLLIKAFERGAYFKKLGLLGKIRKYLWTLRHGKTLDSYYYTDGTYQEYVGIKAQKIGLSEKDAVLFSLEHCPITLQEYVPKQLELRITMVGKKVFACAIYSQDTPESSVDWRGKEDNVRHEPFQLPPEIEQKCLQVMKRLGLQFGCIDMILTPEGKYVFLELNNNGQWFWVQGRTNMPIAEAIADLLITGDGL